MGPAPRVSFQYGVSYRKTYARETSPAQILNLSLTGAFLAPMGELAPGDELQLCLRVSGQERRIPSRVVWCGRGGCGIEFMPENGRDRRMVADLVGLVGECRSQSSAILEQIIRRVND